MPRCSILSVRGPVNARVFEISSLIMSSEVGLVFVVLLGMFSPALNCTVNCSVLSVDTSDEFTLRNSYVFLWTTSMLYRPFHHHEIATAISQSIHVSLPLRLAQILAM
jgi:hypothetical protein